MDRIARVRSETGFYHVVSRGNNKRPIFQTMSTVIGSSSCFRTAAPSTISTSSPGAS